MHCSMEACRWEELVAPYSPTYNAARSMPILDDRSLEFVSHSPEQTQRLGVRLGELIQPGDLFCLAGDLGSGKTTLAKGVARGWGSLDRVTSPTFVLISEYRRADSSRLYHFDAFRLQDQSEAISLGLSDLLDDHHQMIIEWPDRVEELLPAQRLWVKLSWVDELRRDLQFHANGPRYERLLREFRKAAFGR